MRIFSGKFEGVRWEAFELRRFDSPGTYLKRFRIICILLFSDSLKQAVGHEAIKLLVNVDEDDYESGRFKLLQNLKD